MEEEVWGCFAGDTVGDLFRIQGTLNQHGYHSILPQYAIPSGLRLVGLSFVFQQDNDPTHLQAVWGLFDQEWELWSAASDDMASTIIWPQPNWDGLGWVGPQCQGKAANKYSAYVETPSRRLEKHSSWSWLRECQECNAVIKATGGYFEESHEYVCPNFWLVLCMCVCDIYIYMCAVWNFSTLLVGCLA